MSEFIPFNRICRGSEELEAVQKVMEEGSWHGDGPVGKRVETLLCQWLGARHCFLTTSCTHALEMAMIVLEIGPGDEVIMPGFTFVSTANAVCMRGGTPVFAEIRDDDLNLDPDDVARRITPATRAVIPVHYAGVSADFDGLHRVIKEQEKGNGTKIAIVEDAAQALGARWNDRFLGTVGDIGCFSFHDTKNITCGEGGAFVTGDEELAVRAERVREKGTNRSAFLRGEVDKYTWVGPGSSYIPSEILSAVLEAQLQKKEAIQQARESVWNTYRRVLEPAADRGWIFLPQVPAYARPNYHIFYFRVQRVRDRNPLLKALKNAGIDATFHYVPLHNSPWARSALGDVPALPGTERLADSLIRLPLWPGLSDRIEEVAERVHKVLIRYFDSPG
ncbi:MAG: dTDP-4-amino-4,6-dideoxygalactose transaminase [Balneolaceae bacterium]|nr:MAG: dTDP-4-amino-4,6-dideoxygalactose transaminase [Balneolaceae bacterium]